MHVPATKKRPFDAVCGGRCIHTPAPSPELLEPLSRFFLAEIIFFSAPAVLLASISQCDRAALSHRYIKLLVQQIASSCIKLHHVSASHITSQHPEQEAHSHSHSSSYSTLHQVASSCIKLHHVSASHITLPNPEQAHRPPYQTNKQAAKHTHTATQSKHMGRHIRQSALTQPLRASTQAAMSNKRSIA